MCAPQLWLGRSSACVCRLPLRCTCTVHHASACKLCERASRPACALPNDAAHVLRLLVLLGRLRCHGSNLDTVGLRRRCNNSLSAQDAIALRENQNSCSLARTLASAFVKLRRQLQVYLMKVCLPNSSRLAPLCTHVRARSPRILCVHVLDTDEAVNRGRCLQNQSAGPLVCVPLRCSAASRLPRSEGRGTHLDSARSTMQQRAAHVRGNGYKEGHVRGPSHSETHRQVRPQTQRRCARHADPGHQANRHALTSQDLQKPGRCLCHGAAGGRAWRRRLRHNRGAARVSCAFKSSATVVSRTAPPTASMQTPMTSWTLARAHRCHPTSTMSSSHLTTTRRQFSKGAGKPDPPSHASACAFAAFNTWLRSGGALGWCATTYIALLKVRPCQPDRKRPAHLFQPFAACLHDPAALYHQDYVQQLALLHVRKERARAWAFHPAPTGNKLQSPHACRLRRTSATTQQRRRRSTNCSCSSLHHAARLGGSKALPSSCSPNTSAGRRLSCSTSVPRCAQSCAWPTASVRTLQTQSDTYTSSLGMQGTFSGAQPGHCARLHVAHV